MFQFLIKKLRYGFIVLLGAITVVFLLFNLKPGGPIRITGQSTNENLIGNFVGLNLIVDMVYGLLNSSIRTQT